MVYAPGYWMPAEAQDGYTWVPGWFDGNSWEEGYWVLDSEFQNADVEGWQPESGWDEGWEAGAGWGDGEVIDNNAPVDDDAPLALPIMID